MVTTTETAPIERIPQKKDGGAATAESPNNRTAAPPLSERAHGSPTAALPSKKARGPQKAAAPESLLFAAEATFAALTPVFAHRARCRIDAPRSLD